MKTTPNSCRLQIERTRGLFTTIILLMLGSITACAGNTENSGSTEQDVARRRNGPFGIWGQGTNYYLFGYQSPTYRKTSARCWYANEVVDGASDYSGISTARRHFRAMSRAQRLVDFPLDDGYVHEHLRFWGAAHTAFGVLDAMNGPAICSEAVVGAIVTPVVPIMIFPTIGAAAVNGEPWSVLKVPGAPWRSRASSSASTQNPLSMVFESRQLSTRRVCQSMTATK
jgi:hypothetical protein